MFKGKAEGLIKPLATASEVKCNITERKMSYMKVFVYWKAQNYKNGLCWKGC